MCMKEFDKIIGYASVKKELEQIADVLKNGDVYAKLGVVAPKGLLLHGEPGLGKTLMASCLIEASGRPHFICRKNKPNGDFVKAIKETFAEAAKNAPSIIFLDDMDKFANGDERHPDAEEYVTVQSCIDEVKDKEVFVLATANNTSTLPDSLLRAGRFDRVIEIEVPVGEDAVNIIEHYIKGKPFAEDVDAKIIARIMDGHSCAELETVINEAGLYAGYQRSEKITMQHFIDACLQTVFDVPIKVADDNKDNWVENLQNPDCLSTQIVYHEAGHAVIEEILNPNSVTLVSAYNRKFSSGGFTTLYRNRNELPLQRQMKRVVGALGGMAATEQKFGITDSGTTRDLNHAFRVTMGMIENECICGFDLHKNGYDDSEALKNRREQATAIQVEKYYRKAKEILSLNWEFLEKLARELAEQKILDTADVQKIKSECKITPVNL